MKIVNVLTITSVALALTACPAEPQTRVTDWGSWVEHATPHTPDYELVKQDDLGAFNPARPECLIAPSAGLYEIKVHAVWSVNQFGTRELGLWVERASGAVEMIAPVVVESSPDDIAQVQQFVQATEALGAGDCVFVRAEHTAMEKKRRRKKVPSGLNFGAVSFWMARQ